MAIDVREIGLTPAELDPVATFFRENGYGPAGVDLTGEMLCRVLSERGIQLLLAGEQRGRIVGTVGFSRMSGRRVAPQGQVYAGMFVIAAAHRSGMLAGRLFTESFDRLLRLRVRGLRVEVNPANARAFPLYVRVGFRALHGTVPDEEGYVELVSLLPAAAIDLLENAGTWTGMAVDRRHIDWRTISSSRRCGVEDGVAAAEGRPTVTYDFHIPPHRIAATMDAERCRIVALVIDDLPAPGFLPPEIVPQRSEETSASPRSFGDFRIEVDAAGTLTVTHPRHLGFVVSDPLPVTSVDPSGPRRPVRRDVRVTTTPAGWLATDGTVTRDIAVNDNGIRVTARTNSSETLVCAPWVGLRVAELAVEHEGGRRRSGPALFGIWPPDVVDFEATVDEGDVPRGACSSVSWIDRARGLAVTAHPRRARVVRVEGRHLARLSGEREVSYDISLPLASAMPTTPDRMIARPHASQAIDWQTARRGRSAVMRADSSAGSLMVAPDHGLVEWVSPAGSVLASGFPAHRAFGSLPEASAAAWVTLQADRTDLDRGAAWPHPSTAVAFTKAPAGEGWWLETNGATGELEVTARSSAAVPGDELVLSLLVSGSPRRVRMRDSGGRLFDVDERSMPWRGWTREAAVEIEAEWLRVSCTSDSDGEVLVRSTPQGMLLAAFSRVRHEDDLATWRVTWEHA